LNNQKLWSPLLMSTKPMREIRLNAAPQFKQ
jgi:hypothetical protein